MTFEKAIKELKDRQAYLKPTKYGANIKGVYWLRSPYCYSNYYAYCVGYTDFGGRAVVKIKK